MCRDGGETPRKRNPAVTIAIELSRSERVSGRVWAIGAQWERVCHRQGVPGSIPASSTAAIRQR
jgi:hypothetical protein